MGKVTLEMIQAAYTYAKDVRRNVLSPYEAVTRVIEEIGMNEASAGILLGSILKILNGELYTWGISAEAVDYLLAHILEDFGEEEVRKAITAIRQHVRYKKNGKKGAYAKVESVVYQFEVSNGYKKA
ncbi:MAG: hypothetical protein ACRDDX_07200 [Cellulosilyticaceae bacterium]